MPEAAIPRIRGAALAALLVGAVSGAGCGNGLSQDRACTEIGCNDGLSWSFSRPLKEPGTYAVELELDGVAVTCQASLPFSGCASGGGCSSDNVLLEQSGCALPTSEHSLLGIRVLSSPARARIAVRHDGAELVRDEITPSYVRSQPNGEGCPPICEQAGATLLIP